MGLNPEGGFGTLSAFDAGGGGSTRAQSLQSLSFVMRHRCRMHYLQGRGTLVSSTPGFSPLKFPGGAYRHTMKPHPELAPSGAGA